MKSSIIIFSVTLIIFTCINDMGNSLFAQSPTTQGKEFYFSFMQNGYRVCNGSSYYESLSCIISSKKACSGTISNPNTGWSTNFSVTENGITTILIPETESYSTNSEVVENLGLIVTSTDTISLFIANEATNSFDASNVLPLDALEDKYIVQNYIPSPNGALGSCDENVKSAFIIIATENNTVIDIIPTCITANSKPANTTFTITLNKGQSYQVMSKNNGNHGDLSGSLIQARECKKIAVFNGNIITGIPISEPNGFDHIFEQAMPILYWGNKFAITASMTRQGDFIRITALNNNTQIKVNNTVLALINERDTYEFFLSDTSCYLETSGPCAVFLYQTTSSYDNSIYGDPSMVWVTPIEQQVKEITFGTFTATNTIVNHYINIVTETTNINSIWLDNVNISQQFHLLSGNPDLSFARITISHGTHTLKSNTGFTAFVYGFGDVRGYAYSIGSSAVNLTGNIIVNQTNIINSNTSNSRYFCKNELLDFRLNVNYEFDSIRWDLGDGTIIKTKTIDSITHSYINYGMYSVVAIVKLRQQNCKGSTYDTIQGYINIPELKKIIYDTACLRDNYTKYEFSLPADSLDYIGSRSFSKVLKSIYNCDSIHILHLTVKPTYLFTQDSMVVCINSDLYWHNIKLPTSTLGIYYINDTLKTIECQCDSIFQLFLTVSDRIKVKAISNDTLFCNGDILKLDILNNTPFDNIQWTGPDNFSSSLRNFSLTVLSVSNTGLYIASADSVDGCHIIPDTVNITVLDPIIINLTDTIVICNSGIIYSNCSGADYFLWNTGDITENIVVSISGFYWLKASNQRCFIIDSIFIVELNSFDFYIQKSGNLCDEDDMILFVDLPEVDYLWNTKETVSSITVYSSGEYSVTVSLEECVVSKSISIFCDCHLWIPNTFTPNNDGMNDTFIPIPQEELNSFSMSIYDRWGSLIYKTNSYVSWDGRTINGEYATAGTYTYSISFSCINKPDKKFRRQGRISLIR